MRSKDHDLTIQREVPTAACGTAPLLAAPREPPAPCRIYHSLDADNIAKSQAKQHVMDGKSISVPADTVLTFPAAICRESRFLRVEHRRIRSHSPLQAAGNAFTPEFRPPASHINAGIYAPREPAPIVDDGQPLISARVGATKPMKLRKDCVGPGCMLFS